MDHRNFFYKLLYERNTIGCEPISIYNSAKNNRYLLQRLCLEKKLNVHAGCVNTICWNSTGQYLLSGSDDLHLCITDAFTNEIKASIRTGHATNIFSAKYLPNTSDSQVVSCSGDGVIIYTDLNRPETSTKNIFDCQEESVYDIATVPNDSHSFLTCSHDHTVRWYDLRVKSSCIKHPTYSRFARRQHKCTDDVLIRCDYPVTAIAVNSLMPWQLAIGCSDSIVRIYDRRMLSTKSLGGYSCDQDSSVLAKFTYNGVKSSNRITSLAYSRNCQQILASYSNDHLYLFDINDVRNTINTSLEADIIPEKNEKQPSCSFKRFRLRGDWSDTGPNALTSDELRAANPNTGAARGDPSSIASSNPTPANTSVTTQNNNSSTNNSGNSSAGSTDSRSSDARIRHLNTILSLILRNSFRGSNESLHSENNNLSSDEAVAAQSSSGAADQSSNEMVIDSAANDPRVPNNNNIASSSRSSSSGGSSNSLRGQAGAESTSTAAANNNDSSEQQHSSFFINIFGDDDFPSYLTTRRYNENEDEEAHEEDFMDDDDDIDSDTTNDSVFNHNDSSSLSSSAFVSGRQRSRSSSSNDSSRRVRRRTRSNRSTSYRQRRLYESSRQAENEAEEMNKEREKRLKTYKIRNYKTFTGHRNSRTVIKEATFWGDDYIVSGSDCGHIFFWSIEDQKLAMFMEGDHHVVNCLQPHPTDPILASSGIDYDIKIWSPRSEECKFDEKRAKRIMDRNKLLLEESRDTVTVPARFVLSLFSTLRNRQQADRNRESGNNSRNDDGWIHNNDSNMDEDHDEVEL